MKLKSFLFLLCFGLATSVFATKHMHPKANAETSSSAKKSIQFPGYCEIEVINDSFEDVRVYGIYDDGLVLPAFTAYSFGAANYISLWYYGYCHAGMHLYVDNWRGQHLYSGYTPVGTTLRVITYFGQPKIEVKAK